jgi:hypothetical protein
VKEEEATCGARGGVGKPPTRREEEQKATGGVCGEAVGSNARGGAVGGGTRGGAKHPLASSRVRTCDYPITGEVIPVTLKREIRKHLIEEECSMGEDE